LQALPQGTWPAISSWRVIAVIVDHHFIVVSSSAPVVDSTNW
jgi:hypothetical protein